eukprot:3199578-Prymnesium_polylepis.2
MAPPQASLFTGWADVELTALGKNEAATAATSMWREGITFDLAFTSRLKRAYQTLDIVLDITDQQDIPVHRTSRLNERMYGALTGLNKKETTEKYGEAQVKEVCKRCGSRRERSFSPLRRAGRRSSRRRRTKSMLPPPTGAVAPLVQRAPSGRGVRLAALPGQRQQVLPHPREVSAARRVPQGALPLLLSPARFTPPLARPLHPPVPLSLTVRCVPFVLSADRTRSSARCRFGTAPSSRRSSAARRFWSRRTAT